MYLYILDTIEEAYFDTEEACELDKAWFGSHYALNDGQWTEDSTVKSKKIFGGAFLLDSDEYAITLKTQEDIKEIVKYFGELDDELENIIVNGFNNTKAEDLDLPKNDDLRDYLIGWSSDTVAFYKNALEKILNVIFTVDL